MIPDIAGEGGRIRRIPIPAAVKVRIDDWLHAAALTEGKLFRSVNKGNGVTGEGIADEKAICRLVVEYAAQTSLGTIASLDLWRTCAKLCRKAGGNLEQIQFFLGHASVALPSEVIAEQQLVVSCPLGAVSTTASSGNKLGIALVERRIFQKE